MLVGLFVGCAALPENFEVSFRVGDSADGAHVVEAVVDSDRGDPTLGDVPPDDRVGLGVDWDWGGFTPGGDVPPGYERPGLTGGYVLLTWVDPLFVDDEVVTFRQGGGEREVTGWAFARRELVPNEALTGDVAGRTITFESVGAPPLDPVNTATLWWRDGRSFGVPTEGGAYVVNGSTLEVSFPPELPYEDAPVELELSVPWGWPDGNFANGPEERWTVSSDWWFPSFDLP